MAVKLRNINPTVKVNGNAVTGTPTLTLNNDDLIETTTTGASVEILSDSTPAAFVQGPNSGITAVYFPPTYSLTRIFYNNSYRYKLQTPGGYVGIRG